MSEFPGSIFETWSRNSFEVQAVQVTEKNMRQVSGACGGSLVFPEDGPQYIALGTYNHTRGRAKITKVRVNDWVVWTERRFKAYRDSQFREIYHRGEGYQPPVKSSQPKDGGGRYEDVHRIIQEAIRKLETAVYLDQPKTVEGVSQDTTQKIIELFS